MYIPKVSKGQVSPSSRFESDHFLGSYLKVGKIVYVDYETMTCDIVYMDSIGGAARVPISSPYVGPRSFMGAMPSADDWVIVGFGKSGNFSYPMILQYFPIGYPTSIAGDILGVPDAIKEAGWAKPIRLKMQKLYEAELYGSSKFGAEFYFDKNVSISDSKLDEISINSYDRSINFSSLNTNTNACGIRVRSGLIYRNDLLDDPEFLLKNGKSLFPVFYTEDGIPRYAVTFSDPINKTFPYGRFTPDDEKPVFIEHRLEVNEIDEPVLPVTSSNSGVEVDTLYKQRLDGKSNKPLVVQVIGTLVGNDPTDKNNYGVILKPKIFTGKSEVKGKGTAIEEACVTDNGNNESLSLAAAYTLKFPNTPTALYVNKQGKLFLNVGSSTSVDPMGAGESIELGVTGHTKVYLGKNTGNMSLSLYSEGGISTNLGFNSESMRSWEGTFRRGVYWNIQGADKDNASFRMDTAGDVRYKIVGSRFTEVKGDDIRIVHGVLEDRVLGKKIDNYINDKVTNYGGAYTETAIGHKSETLSSGRSITIYKPNITSGDTVADKTDIKLGSYEHSILLGNREENIGVGNFNTNMITGSRTFSIRAGSYSLELDAGTINIRTAVGSVTVKAGVGTVEINGGLGVTIKSAVKVTLDAPRVEIGNLPGQGGVVTDGALGHKCYITGGPHLGSRTVSCNTT